MWEKVIWESDSTGKGEEQVSRGAERGAGGPSGCGGDFSTLAMPALASKDEKLLINFCVFICAVMGLILINGTLLL